MTEKRIRKKFDFQLTISKKDEFELANLIPILRKKRLYSRTIRDGIRLICDLRDGNMDVLFELFPWVKDKLSAPSRVGETPAEKSLRLQLERVEMLLKMQGAVPITSSTDGIKSMDVPQFDAPSFDEDEDEEDVVLELKPASNGKETAQNFIDSMLNLQN